MRVYLCLPSLIHLAPWSQTPRSFYKIWVHAMRCRPQTNNQGIYTAEELNVGAYTVGVESRGFKTAEATNL